jgi:transcriptional regulator with PAS, ATPase and Fis domain
LQDEILLKWPLLSEPEQRTTENPCAVCERDELTMSERVLSLIGGSPQIRQVEEELTFAAHCDAKVLITGESGVGKEVVARLIHHRSGRRQGPLVTINCAGIPDTLLASELFGHVRGSFTDAYTDKRGWLEQANGGTVFMDEVGEMSAMMQGLVLRFLENGEIQPLGSDRRRTAVDVRVITATNRRLIDRVAAGEFREDLYYRLNVIHIDVPPLRDRPEDIPLLFDHFLRELSAKQGSDAPRIGEEVHNRLVACAWPGNARQLRNLAESLVVRARTGVTLADLPRELFSSAASQESPVVAGPPRTRDEILWDRMVTDGESFWTVVYEPFMSRDLTRDDLRAIVRRGLEATGGSYRNLLSMFNLPADDYKRLLNFLRKFQSHVPIRQFQAAAGSGSPSRPVRPAVGE